MDFRTNSSSLNRSNLLSLAKNMSRSTLLTKSILKHPTKTSQNQQTIKKSPSDLIYSNIIPSKERSRSVSVMMSSLIKQNDKTNENKPQPNVKPVPNISTPSVYSTGNSASNYNELAFTPILKETFINFRNCESNNVKNNELETINNDRNILLNNNVDNFRTNDLNGNDIYNKYRGGFISNRCSTNQIHGTHNDNYVHNANNQNGINYIYRSKTAQMTYQEEDDTSQEQFNQKKLSRQCHNNVQQYFTPITSIDSNQGTIDNDKYTHLSKTNSNYNGFRKHVSTSTSTTPNRNISMIGINKPNYSNNLKNINGNFGGMYITRNNKQQHLLSPALYSQHVINIQLEDLIVLEEKLYHIIDSFRIGNKLSISKLCTEWWTFYTYSSFNSKFEFIFQDYREIAHDTSILELISIILLYEVLKDPKTNQSTLETLKNLIHEIHQNFLIICDFILTKLIFYNTPYNSFWLSKLQNIILSKRSHKIYKNEHYNMLKKNVEYISNILRKVFRLYTSSTVIDISALHFYFKKINSTSIKTVNDFFRKKINQDSCKKGDSLSFVINEQTVTQNIPVPYLQQNITDKKSFTLVLDLDETLISFRREDAKKGILRLRPGLHTFLAELKQLYEIIVFTTGTQEYADPILNAIEKQGNFFDKRLYRQHATVIDNIFVKDLSRLGRDISKVIIIDNMPHNFRLQKENGIFIKNFYGENSKDTALLDLIPILKEIACNEHHDVRIELKKYENEIFTKITTDLIDEAE